MTECTAEGVSYTQMLLVHEGQNMSCPMLS
jgi:hypothetical protein